MKKFFTLFALLSVGLSAWAQDYKISWEYFGMDYEFLMIKNKDGKYSVRKLIFGGIWDMRFQVIDMEEGEYLLDEYCEPYLGDHFYNEDGSWIDLTFTYDPEYNELEVSHNDGTVWYDADIYKASISLSDEVTIGSEGNDLNISYTRSDCKTWGTLCLPFRFYTSNLSSDVTFYKLSSVTKDAMIFSKYVEGDYGVPAGTPLVFKINDGSVELSIFTEGGALATHYNAEPTVDGWTMYGTPKDETTIDAGWVMQSNEIREVAEDGFPIKPYRVWFSGTRPSGAPLRIEVDDTEGLQFVEQEDGTVKVSYDLQGRKLNEARKGLMIENGKVIMVK